jgi:hypothetical protein
MNDQNQNPEVTLTLSLMEVNKVSEALSALPLKDIIDIFMKLREQTMKQLQALQQQPAPTGLLADKVIAA